jgi:hypothetical protein
MGALFPYGCGIFFFFDEIDSEEREEILDDVIDRYRYALGPEPEARHWIEEYRVELDKTRSAYPGIERRDSSLEKTSQLVEERLVREVQRIRSEDATKFVRSFMFGDQELGRDLGLEEDDVLGLISLPLVREGAMALQQLNPEALFAKDGGYEEYHLEDFLRWRQLYLDAAANGEALLLGVC